MLNEDIQPGYAPKEISFGGYTTHNLHHSADAAKAFQETIQKAYNGEIKRPDLIRTALEHTDQYMKLNDMHLEQGKAPDDQEITQWRHAHETAKNALEQIGEFMHHEDYWHMHGHELEAMETQYNPATAGFDANDLASSYEPEGTMIKEGLTDKTIRSNDKIKVARVIADMLGIENAEAMSPDVAVNAGLRKIKNKRMTPEYTATIKKMVALAQEVGIKVDHNVMPATVAEAKDPPTVDKDSDYNFAKGVLRFNDFLKLSKINNGVVPVDASSPKKIGEQKGIRPQDPNSSDEGDQTDETGHVAAPQQSDQVRRMKIRYRTEEVQLEDLQSADYKVSADGHKYRARHIEFKNSGKDGTLNDDEDDNKKEAKVKSTKPLLKKVAEEAKKDEYEFSEKELDDLANSVDTEDDLEDVYDGDEFEIIDDETGEPVEDEKEEVKEEVLNEVLSRMARLRARTRFLQTRTKRARRLKIALKTHSNVQTVNRRARKLAINLMKQRIMKKPVAQFTVAEKERVEKIMSNRKAAIDRLAMKLVPRIRKIEQARFAHTKFTKSAPSAAM